MSIGISTACYFPLEVEQAYLEIAKSGADCAEIFFNARRELKNSFLEMLLEIKAEYGCQIVSIHPMLSFAEPYFIFSLYERRFEESREDFKRYFEIANILGAKIINLHGDRPNGRLQPEEYCERYALLQQDAKAAGVLLCQENVNGYRAGEPDFLREMVAFLGPEAHFTLDIKQCIRAGCTVDEIMESMNYQIEHVHLSDHSPGGDCLLPGQGGFNFKALFQQLQEKGFRGNGVIEVYDNAYQSMDEIPAAYDQLKNNMK